jgi:hypothetical protein
VSDAEAGEEHGRHEERYPVLVSWDELEADPQLGIAFQHLIALDPSSASQGEALLASIPATGDSAQDADWLIDSAMAPSIHQSTEEAGAVHLVWGPAETEFAQVVARRDLDLRPLVASLYRSLRGRGGVHGDELERALRGDGPHPLPAAVCARALTILAELELASMTRHASGLEVEAHERPRTELDRSPTYRAALTRLAEAERRLASAPIRARAA